MNTKYLILTILLIILSNLLSACGVTPAQASSGTNFEMSATIKSNTFFYSEPKKGSYASYYVDKELDVYCQDRQENGYAYCQWTFRNDSEPIFGWVLVEKLVYNH